MFKVRPSPNKGFGVFTSAPIPSGSIVMLDPLILKYNADEGLEQVYRRFSNLTPSTQQEVWKLQMHQDRTRHTVLAAQVKDNLVQQIRLKAILDCNGVSLGDGAPGGPAGLFLRGSRINHSCVPNAEGYFHRSGHLSVRSLRDIGPSEEVTISYIYHLLPQAQRQELLDR